MSLLTSPLAAQQQTYLKASNSWGFDRFGSAIAIDGDLMVVGSFREDSGTTGVNGDEDNDDADNSGAAYVYIREDGNWKQEAFLKASNTEEEDRFGHSIAISGNTIVVGAERESGNAFGVNGDESDNSANRAGAAYVFVRENGEWSQQAYLKASDTEEQARFGSSVAIDGDMIVVGAPRQDGSSGSAYVYRRSGSDWAIDATLTADNAEDGDFFGWSVAIEGGRALVGAIDEDGLMDINARPVESASLANNDAPSSGAAYLFEFQEGGWSQQYYFKGSRLIGGETFGVSVDLHDGRALIGASSHLTGESARGGAAYLFEANGSGWSEVGYFPNPASLRGGTDQGDGDNFGFSVALSDQAFVIGASGEDGSSQGLDGDISNNLAPDAGAAYLYRLLEDEWTFGSYLKASNAEGGDRYGQAVGISGDTLIVGAHQEDSSASGINGSQGNETGQVESGEKSGAVYILEPGELAHISSVSVEQFPAMTRVTATFTGMPGVTNWSVFGSSDLGLNQNLTNEGLFTEVADGQYEFTVTFDELTPRFFLQIRQ